ncbi:DOMON domain-containing protein [Desulfoluna spongiiphila]|uniref:DOMON domain-containing protein n=1 Tax=Desulfoluna spongiiphila TaxID=419481 RepID=A0A1G5H2K2_9BACT|nr:DOMON domain-containing protein [Desulfoluna spongiiphila]SCY57964.1 DOMON domain-containing protein [Desulfoluna spongiiphila]VVS94746.1 consensus disorder prediction [Desulfoluna spongiiphila]
MKRLAFGLMLLVLLWGGWTLASSHDFQHTIDDGPMSFSWTVDGENLHVKLTGKTTGWVGVGFNPEKMMKGANFIMGYVKGGKVKVTDHIGNNERNHKADKKSGGANNTSDIAGSEEGGVTEIFFTIPLNSGDSTDTALDPGGVTTVLLGMGGGRDSFRSVHKFRSVHQVTLSTGASEKVK